jgi:hypothetical protein
VSELGANLRGARGVSSVQCAPRENQAHPLLEQLPLLQSERVTLGNHWYDVYDLGQLLHDGDVDGLERVAGGGDEVEAAVDASVDNVLVAHCGKLLAKVGRVLVLDVLDDGVPAVERKGQRGGERRGAAKDLPSLVVDKVAVARGIDNVEAKLDVVLLDDYGRQQSQLGASYPPGRFAPVPPPVFSIVLPRIVTALRDSHPCFSEQHHHHPATPLLLNSKRLTVRNGLNLGSLPHGLVRLEATLGVNEMRCEDGVDEGGLAESSLA